jgi:hypothetical protein
MDCISFDCEMVGVLPYPVALDSRGATVCRAAEGSGAVEDFEMTQTSRHRLSSPVDKRPMDSVCSARIASGSESRLSRENTGRGRTGPKAFESKHRHTHSDC